MPIIRGLSPEKIERKYSGMFAVGAPGNMPEGASAAPPMGGMPGGEGGPPPMGGMPGGEGGPPPMGGPGGAPRKPSFPTVCVKNGKIETDKSKQENILSGSFGNASTKDVKLVVKDDGFTGGLYVDGGEYVLEDAVIELDGNGISLGGANSGVFCDNKSNVVLKNCKITTNGSARCATSTENGSTMKVYNSTLISHGAPFGSELPPGAFMANPPAALEIEGNCRTHVTMGNSFSYFYDSEIIADGWAALSTDISNGWVYLEANRCKVVTVNSGYGAYADGGCHDVFNDCDFDVASMAGIIAGESDMTFNLTKAKCGTYFALIHCIGTPVEVTELDVNGGEIECKDPVVLLKSSCARISFDGVKINSECGVLIKSILNDDPNARGAAEIKGQTVYGIRPTFKNGEYAGDILHTDHEMRPMFVSLINAKLIGCIQNAYLALDAKSKWVASGDSTIIIDGRLDVTQIDAPANVVITAIASEDGEYSLPSGGKLVIKTYKD